MKYQNFDRLTGLMVDVQYAQSIIIGNRELRGRRWFLIDDVVWVIYIAGQALIVLTSAWSQITT